MSNLTFKGRFVILLSILIFISCFRAAYCNDLLFKLSGRILLQAESKGEAWYVSSIDEKKYFLWPYGWDLSGRSVSTFFPISVNKCLVYTNFDLNINDLRDCFIREAIILAYHQKHRFVFSDRNDKYIQKNIDTFPLTNYFK